MATLREANLAREEHSRSLIDLGAHSIAVDEIRRKKGKTFAVIAYFERKPSEAPPSHLEVATGKKTVKVPLVMEVAERFRPEGL